MWIACAEFVQEHAGLRVLATEAEHRSSGDVGVVDVAGEQTTKGLRILPRSAAAAFVGEEADSVDVGEDTFGTRLRQIFRAKPVAAGLTLHEFADVAAVAIMRTAIAQLLFEGFAQAFDVAVFTEDKRKDDPVVARTHLAVGAPIAHEGARGPWCWIRQGKRSRRARRRVVAGAMANGARGDEPTAGNDLESLPDHHAVEIDQVAGRKIHHCELVFGGDVVDDGARPVAKTDDGSAS